MDNSLVNVLGQLGLTEYEAKILATLFELRETQAPEISRNAQVPKTRVYDVLDRLTKKGLLIEIFGRPKKYRCIEPADALDELVRQKRTELSGLEQQIGELKTKLSAPPKENEEPSEKVMKVKDKTDFWKILGQEISGAKNEIIAFSPHQQLDPSVQEAFKQALNHNVKVKMLHQGASSESTRLLSKNGAQVAQHEHGLHAYLIDQQKVVMGLTDFNQTRGEYHFSIWNHHAPLANALRTHFDTCWNNAKK